MRQIVLTMVAATLLSGSFVGQAVGKSQDAALIAARQKFFGLENVNDKTGKVRDDRVVFSWLTNATFAAAMKGHVVLLDTFDRLRPQRRGRQGLRTLEDARWAGVTVDAGPDVITYRVSVSGLSNGSGPPV